MKNLTSFDQFPHDFCPLCGKLIVHNFCGNENDFHSYTTQKDYGIFIYLNFSKTKRYCVEYKKNNNVILWSYDGQYWIENHTMPFIETQWFELDNPDKMLQKIQTLINFS